MITEENLESILKELLPNNPIDSFSIKWILDSPKATEDSIRSVYTFLINNRLKDEKIATHAKLLGNDPKTIDRNYQHYVGLLRQNYKNRNSGKDILLNQVQLLGISPNTMESNVQFLYGLGVDYNNGMLLGTKTQTKRQKMAWMLREMFDYRTVTEDRKREAISGLYNFIKDNPRILIDSINSMERKKYKLREKVKQYKV